MEASSTSSASPAPGAEARASASGRIITPTLRAAAATTLASRARTGQPNYTLNDQACKSIQFFNLFQKSFSKFYFCYSSYYYYHFYYFFSNIIISVIMVLQITLISSNLCNYSLKRFINPFLRSSSVISRTTFATRCSRVEPRVTGFQPPINGEKINWEHQSQVSSSL